MCCGKYFLFALMSCWPAFLVGQDEVVDAQVKVNKQTWLDYNFSKPSDNGNDISTQIGFRTISPEVYDRLLVISTYNIKNRSEKKYLKLFTSFHLGAGVINTWNYNAEDNFEIRLLQGIRFNLDALKIITLNNYLRFEERLQNTFSSDLELAFRLRYKLSTAISWQNHLIKFTEGVYLPLEAEVFYNLRNAARFNDLLRISPGVGYMTKKGWRFELYLMYNLTRNIMETNNTSNDFILRIRIRDERGKKVDNSAPVKSVKQESPATKEN